MDMIDLMLLAFQESLAVFHADPSKRATSDKGCLYLTEDGRKCAVGILIDPASYQKRLENNDAVFALDSGFRFLRPEYHKVDVGFWVELQNIHDLSSRWTEDGLSASGWEGVKFMCGHYDIPYARAVRVIKGEETISA